MADPQVFACRSVEKSIEVRAHLCLGVLEENVVAAEPRAMRRAPILIHQAGPYTPAVLNVADGYFLSRTRRHSACKLQGEIAGRVVNRTEGESRTKQLAVADIAGH